MPSMTETLARRAVEKTTADRQARYAQEMERIVEATYDFIEQTGNLEPSLREILAHCGLSTQGFYRYFRSKDELLLVLIDDGRRRLVEYLVHRMESESAPEEKIRTWIVGVLAQASNPRAADRTRPFVANEDRITELFPEEQRQSIDQLVNLLVEPLDDLVVDRSDRGETQLDAEAIYQVVFGTLRTHLVRHTRPSAIESTHLVRFCLNGIGSPEGSE
jgi:AcrR family transcriptional regulator